jgi:protein ImuB
MVDIGPTPARIVTVWLPDWPATAAGFDADAPAAVMHANRVVARTAAAAAEGVVIGQRRRQAQQRYPEIELIDHDPARDAREFESVVRSVADLAPRLDVVEPGWIGLAARGPSRYFGGDRTLVDRLTSQVGAVVRAGAGAADGAVGVGVADGRFASSIAARLAVRRGEPVVVEPGGSPAFCAPLPIGWLQALGESDPELVDLFARLGLRRLGDLAGLVTADVMGRFSHPGLHAHRLASGADIGPPSTTDPAPERRLDRVLDEPVAQAAAVVFVAKQLADELAGALAAEGRVCIRLVVLLETEHGERSERSWFRSAGITAAAMVERVRWQLDGWVNQPRGSEQQITGGIALIRLTPDEVRADIGSQLGLWGGQSEADRRAGRAIARLTTLTTESAVTVPVWNGGRLPADRYRWVPAAAVDLDQRVRAVSRSATGSGPDGPWPGCLPSPSPATVYADAHPVEVLDVDGRSVRVGGRGTVSARPAAFRLLSGDESSGWRRGRSHTIRAWAGPWPVEEQWWEPARHRRLARFQMVTDDEQGYLVVAEHRRWWVSARYD